MDTYKLLRKQKRKQTILIALLAALVVILGAVCLFVGSSNMTLSDCVAALLRKGSAANVRILWNIRIPRVLAAVIAGAGLSVAGLIMQTTLNNSMAAPSTLGVSNAAVFGANLSIIVFAGGFLSTGNNLSNLTVGANPFSTSLLAFAFAALSTLLILGLCTGGNGHRLCLDGCHHHFAVLCHGCGYFRRCCVEFRRPGPGNLPDGSDHGSDRGRRFNTLPGPFLAVQCSPLR